ncbi:hypothetical protein Ate02nite_30960 [Paractinoplanes tereljensis]|uniref:Pectinacetylesterase n=2 Tax=Paractinoplanes tereljensis TaxID=571912 RepID=A0A919NLW6_9ACTN|nr:hypothetical protein Ate02nite_30960 [Actinoplanes tereljensis]
MLAALTLLLGGCHAAARRQLEWTRIAAAADCHCADGSPFAFWERRADAKKVVFFLNGGGVCWDAASCAFTGEHGENDNYDWSLVGTDPENRAGLFDTTRSDNPFAGYSYLYVSSCTGDAHLGTSGLHHGYANGTAALDYLAARYPDATQVVVVGKTAGSVAAPLYGREVANRLPKAKVIVFGAQSGAWPDSPALTSDLLEAQWGAAVDGRTVPRFWIQKGLVLARFDFAYDPHASREVTRWMDGSLLATIDRNEATIEAAGVTLHSYTAPGADHQIFELDKFYGTTVNGVRLVDWLKDLVTGKPPADVHCTECGP